MRKAGILAKRYAKALFLVGRDRDLLDRLHEEMKQFVAALEENPEFYYFFVSPEVARKDKKEQINNLFGESFSQVFLSFLQVILDKGREALLLAIAEAFGETLDEYQNRVKAQVTTSIPLTPQMQQEIKNRLEKQLGKEVVLIPTVDESILGGIRITIEGKVIDGTVKAQLHRMRDFLLEQSAAAVN